MNLEEHVTELIHELGVIATPSSVGQLVCLLERVRHDRALVLLTIPRALAPQATSDLIQTLKRGWDLRIAGAIWRSHWHYEVVLVVVVDAAVVVVDAAVVVVDGVVSAVVVVGAAVVVVAAGAL